MIQEKKKEFIFQKMLIILNNETKPNNTEHKKIIDSANGSLF